jgi:hypothetical protein
MSDYYNHVLLWLKSNKPDYVLVRFHYPTDLPDEYYWYLEPVDYIYDILWVGTNTDFEEYIAKFSKEANLRFFKFTEPGKKEEI